MVNVNVGRSNLCETDIIASSSKSWTETVNLGLCRECVLPSSEAFTFSTEGTSSIRGRRARYGFQFRVSVSLLLLFIIIIKSSKVNLPRRQLLYKIESDIDLVTLQRH